MWSTWSKMPNMQIKLPGLHGEGAVKGWRDEHSSTSGLESHLHKRRKQEALQFSFYRKTNHLHRSWSSVSRRSDIGGISTRDLSEPWSNLCEDYYIHHVHSNHDVSHKDHQVNSEQRTLTSSYFCILHTQNAHRRHSYWLGREPDPPIGWELLLRTHRSYVGITYLHCTYNNNNDFFSANVLEDQAQWRDKTKGLSKLVIENNGWMKKLGG